MEDVYFYGASLTYLLVIFLGLIFLKHDETSQEDFFLTSESCACCLKTSRKVNNKSNKIDYKLKIKNKVIKSNEE